MANIMNSKQPGMSVAWSGNTAETGLFGTDTTHWQAVA